MSFLEHLDELRQRLIKSLLSLVVGFAVCWGFAEQIFAIMTQPMKKSFPDITFIYTQPTEAFLLYMKMSFFVGIFVASPYLLYQVWAFVAPGLYRHEKVYAIPFVVFGSLFFVGGAAFGHFILFPITFRFLGQFAGDNMTFLPRVSEYYSFYSWFLLSLGAVFQLPVVIFVMARIGIVSAGFLLRKLKYAVLGAFVLSAVITPTADVVTQSLLALPMLGLYMVGIAVAWAFGRPRKHPEDETTDS